MPWKPNPQPPFPIRGWLQLLARIGGAGAPRKTPIDFKTTKNFGERSSMKEKIEKKWMVRTPGRAES